MSDKIQKKKDHEMYISVYDSMGNQHQEVVQNIQDLISKKWSDIREFIGSDADQRLTFQVNYKFSNDIQRNNYDCALYCCFFMLYISENKEPDFHKTIETSETMSKGMYLRAHFIMAIVTLDPYYPFRLSNQRISGNRDTDDTLTL